EHYGIDPDVITLAKGLGSGFPIGAMLAKGKAAASFTPGTHGSTFGGNPLAATAGYTTMKTILEENILQEVKKESGIFNNKLKEMQKAFPVIQEIKGKGLLIGMEMEGGAGKYISALRDKQVLALSAGETVLRILPPLTVTESEVDEFLSAFKEVLEEA